jgi:GTP-binding protein
VAEERDGVNANRPLSKVKSGAAAGSGPDDPDALSAEDIAAGDALFTREWHFLKGVVDIEGLPPMSGVEIAFAGRSNVGKSSLINAVVRRKGLARTSNTPGRTQEINFFVVPDIAMSIVDLPGYGFAEAPKSKVDTWTRLVKDYLRGRVNLARVYLLIDARHGIKSVDAEIMDMLDEAAVSYQVVLTKADKINATTLDAVRKATTATLTKHAAAYPTLMVTSSQKSVGLEELRAVIAALLTQG